MAKQTVDLKRAAQVLMHVLNNESDNETIAAVTSLRTILTRSGIDVSNPVALRKLLDTGINGKADKSKMSPYSREFKEHMRNVEEAKRRAHEAYRPSHVIRVLQHHLSYEPMHTISAADIRLIEMISRRHPLRISGKEMLRLIEIADAEGIDLDESHS